MKSVYVKDRELYKDITIERNNWKNYIHIDHETGNNEITTMLEKIERETESDIENLLEDTDTKYITEVPILENKEERHQLLTPETTVRVEGKVLGIDEPLAKKRKKKVPELK